MPSELQPDELLVSVVITSFNHARFLGEAIESARDQTYPHVEVVVVDDGSTDETPAVVSGYPSIRSVRQTNQGLSAARNIGLRICDGTFVIFLDADDRLRPNAVAAGLACFREHPESAFVSGDHVRIDADGTFLAPHDPPDAAPDPYLRLLRGNYVGMHAAVMYRRSALLASGGFDPMLPACEDYDLYLRIARDQPVASHEAVVAEYRIHGQNLSRDGALMLKTVLRVLERQRNSIKGDPQREAAYRDGVAIWKAYYSEELVAQLRESVHADQPLQQVLPSAMALARYAPLTLAQRAARSVRRRLRRSLRPSAFVPAVGCVRFGDLRRLTPISRVFGFDRGTPVDRYYIEAFLSRHAGDIRGRTLEIGDDTYTRRFGGAQVEQADVLHAHDANPHTTFVGDLAGANSLPSDAFDCIVLTQTLHLIYDVQAAAATLHRILKPGGVVLVTVPGISQIEDGEWGVAWYWSFTPQSARRLLEAQFGRDAVTVEAHGNVLAAVAFLYGIAAEELTTGEMDAVDPLYPMLVAARAQKAREAA